ncbi:HemK2/MTQ2 family protein methyltransferase [Allokutzneria albata]|uniref:Release factor glutamine methyltransferase n=1 Tax=Allokutzneria albata TaxID=211114 RepID=A0A1G9TRJ1_ALLAB|nr:HemK2/MTQ2 family protein methyltransferase [Allokutzneria albata]SDM50231.1 release factor glutamine methyltransferase [Allokutzneria albata]
MGVYLPQDDTALLIDAMLVAPLPQGARVLDIGTGSGVLARAAADAGAAEVTAIDVSWRALATAFVNTRLSGRRVRLRRGDIRTCLPDRHFDVVLTNPPYVPCGHGEPGRHAPARAWDAGDDGRTLIDPICDRAPALLSPKGMMLMVHSALCDAEKTLRRLRESGLKAAIVARGRCAFGPVMRSRTAWLERTGLIEPGQRDEELVVIRADRTR